MSSLFQVSYYMTRIFIIILMWFNSVQNAASGSYNTVRGDCDGLKVQISVFKSSVEINKSLLLFWIGNVQKK